LGRVGGEWALLRRGPTREGLRRRPNGHTAKGLGRDNHTARDDSTGNWVWLLSGNGL
jgi:hypothetical protein